MNNVTLIGNLGADPESFFTDEGTQIVNFPLAFKSTKKEKTNWIRVTCFNKQGEVAEKYLHKGAKIAISGRLDQQKWVDEGNQTRSTFKLIANQIDFIKTDGRGFENSESNETQTESTEEMDETPF